MSGLAGVGGGVFLAPLLITLEWASAERAAGISAPFVLANSVIGLAGVLASRQRVPQDAAIPARPDSGFHKSGHVLSHTKFSSHA